MSGLSDIEITIQNFPRERTFNDPVCNKLEQVGSWIALTTKIPPSMEGLLTDMYSIYAIYRESLIKRQMTKDTYTHLLDTSKENLLSEFESEAREELVA